MGRRSFCDTPGMANGIHYFSEAFARYLSLILIIFRSTSFFNNILQHLATTFFITELYYISRDRALAKKVWKKTWQISIPKLAAK